MKALGKRDMVSSRIPEPRYMYHSFPRRKTGEDEVKKGLAILEGIVREGLLLTPEIVEWQAERKADGTFGEKPISCCTRVCFTELAASDVPGHADRFGVFALEFTVPTLRQLGAMPIFYVPRHDEHEGMSGIGASYIARITDLQSLLEHLRKFQIFAQTAAAGSDPVETQMGLAWSEKSNCLLLCTPNKAEQQLELPADIVPQALLDELRKTPGVAQPLGLNAHALEFILNMLTWGIQGYQVQLNALRALTGFFYPTERNDDDAPLNYYRQREWRILGGQMKDGVLLMPEATSSQTEALLAIDAEFFGKEIDLRTGWKRRADACEYYRELDGAYLFSFVRRVVCPEVAVDDVRAMLEKYGYSKTPVTSLESLDCG